MHAMMTTIRPLALLSATLGCSARGRRAQELEVIGKPVPEAMGLQPAATDVAIATQALDDFLLWIIVGHRRLRRAADPLGDPALQPPRQPDAEDRSPTTPWSRSPGR